MAFSAPILTKLNNLWGTLAIPNFIQIWPYKLRQNFIYVPT